MGEWITLLCIRSTTSFSVDLEILFYFESSTLIWFTDGDDNGEDIVNEWNAENVDVNQNIVILH